MAVVPTSAKDECILPMIGCVVLGQQLVVRLFHAAFQQLLEHEGSREGTL